MKKGAIGKREKLMPRLARELLRGAIRLARDLRD